MPRVHAIKTTVLHLPVLPSGSASRPKVEPPTLEVLMMARQIAQDRGQVFDIEAFLTPEMREQWYAISHGLPWPTPVAPSEGHGEEEVDAEEEERKPNVQDDAPVEAEAGPSTSGPVPATNGEPPAPDVSGDVTAIGKGNGDTPAADAMAVDDGATPAPPPPPAAAGPGTNPNPALSTPQKQGFKLHANSPALLNLHWKQRQKRLHQLAIREAAIERGEEPEYFPELEALIRGEEEKEKEKEREDEVGQKRKRGLTEGDKETIRASASHWNHLLIEARRMRGPQWDYNTQMFLVDKSSEDYYTHMKDPPSDTPTPSPEAEVKGLPPPTPTSMSNGHTAQILPPHDPSFSSASSSSRPLPPHRQSSSPHKPDQQALPTQLERRPSAASANANATPQQQPHVPLMNGGGGGGTPHMPPGAGGGYNASPSPAQQPQQNTSTPQQQQQQYQPPPPHFNPAQWLAMQAQQHQQQQQQGGNTGGPPMQMNPAMLMQAQQRLQQQRPNINMAALMAGHGQGQGQGQAAWNQAMGMNPAMLQGLGAQPGGGGGGQGGPMLGGGTGADGGGGWSAGQ